MKRNERKTPNGPETALQQFNAVVAFINSFAYVAGIEFTSDWEFNRRAKGNLLMNICLNWVELYTFYVLFPSIACVELSAGCLFSVIVTTKMIFLVFNHRRFMALFHFIYEVAHKNTEGKRQLILLETTKTIFYHFKLIWLGFGFAAIVYMFYPCYDFIFNRNLTPVSPLIFPFAADETTRSFLIATICNIIAPTWNVTGVAAVSCIFMAYVDVYDSLVSLIEDDFHTFDGILRREHQNVQLRKVVFRNIILEIMDLARYNLVMNELFSLITTVQIACCFFGTSATLFGLLANEFFGGIGASLYFMTELMMFSYIGQLMDNQTERIEMIIFHSDWYVYGRHYQQDLLFALCIVQNLKSISVAGILPLNFEAGVAVVKNIYSILMFLLNVLE